jgi:glycosyltransferase involved in cell wall biosynthesis
MSLRTVIGVCVNGPHEKTNGVRVRELFRELEGECDVHYLYRDDARRLASTWRFCAAIARFRPRVVFVEGMGYTGVVAAAFARTVFGSRVILSTGDAAYAFAKACMPFVKAQAVGLLEWCALRLAHAIVVWGPQHKTLLEARGFRNVFWIPGGVDTTRFKPFDAAPLRARLGVADRLTIGVVGSINLNTREQFCYGWEVVEVVRRLTHLPVAGIIVGVGDGVPFLQAKAREYGIEDRIVFTGWVEHAELPAYVNAIDVCVSTQSNDLVGDVRITAKVPEYLACGRFIIATAVGGAQPFVKDCGLLLESRHLKDEDYITAIAGSVAALTAQRHRLDAGQRGVTVARQYFDYAVLRPELRAVVNFATSRTVHAL